MELKKIKKVGIIGVGFMGGSLALALKKSFSNFEIIGHARSDKAFRRLKKVKVLDRIERSGKKIAKEADILILATPVGVIIDFLKRAGSCLKKGSIVFDLGSTKEEIEKVAKKKLPKGVSFVGCHPFCGSEKEGVEEAREDLYRGSLCFITSANRSSYLVERIWKKVGSKVVRTTPAGHDRIVGFVSHLPHLICFSLTNAIPAKYLEFSSSGFRDLTRIASSSSDLWADIFLTNAAKMLKDIDKYNESLNEFRDLIVKRDRQKLKRLIKKANKRRGKLS
ncbi:MAG: prephenate dehydrogenase [Candidatus Omnitrophica bacterium]|nr:prephenate dehydrogenase [Candidatus Omnitrophota bacterium]MCF7891553.1 prephenate dehydrogenase [Candidatus Omnitrophota bacterium]MCF7895758.1 prephenate dehydrogenase [Candidatus Omnitrophota bacterium]MCF7897335.1 prephenate dehydrogenase [Candidatus Omnitrophota bacterium]MCF7909695.1 prephenate dehydrogenase [Candidatus Omnitrophota bacterium]